MASTEFIVTVNTAPGHFDRKQILHASSSHLPRKTVDIYEYMLGKQTVTEDA